MVMVAGYVGVVLHVLHVLSRVSLALYIGCEKTRMDVRDGSGDAGASARHSCASTVRRGLMFGREHVCRQKPHSCFCFRVDRWPHLFAA